jgi:hypothetical protein
MNKSIKDIIILVLVFIVIMWVQNNDDKNKNKIRKGYYDKIKLPLLSSAMVGLFLNFDVDKLVIIKDTIFNIDSPGLTFNPNASINKVPFNPFCSINNQELYMSEFD